MKSQNRPRLLLGVMILLFLSANCLFTRKMLDKKLSSSQKCPQSELCIEESSPDLKLNISTQCNDVDLSSEYNYTGVVRSGYLSVGKGSSVLAFTFYGKKAVTDPSQLRNHPTVIWLNGGPGSSSQTGNMQELGPLRLKRKTASQVVVEANPHSWANEYNVLFVDQPVGTGLSYADKAHESGSFVKSMEEVGNDFYYALNQLYNTNDGCFGQAHLNISPESPLFVFGESYAGKYVPAIARKIVQERNSNNGFLKGLRGIAIGDGFTSPFDILAEVGNWAYHLSLMDYQERMRVETKLLRASKNEAQLLYGKLHDDFDDTLDYIVEQAGDVNVYDIKVDGEYEELLQPYFRDPHILGLYKLSTGILYDGQAEDVYAHLYDDFMKKEVASVEFLLESGLPVLIYNGQDDLIVQSSGTMRWVDNIQYSDSEQFRKSLFDAWRLNGKMVGSIKKAGNLEFRIVNNAGHLVPMDSPEAALDMVQSFVEAHK